VKADAKYKAAKRVADAAESRLKRAKSEFETAESEKAAALTAVNSQKQHIRHIKAYLRTLSRSHPDYDDWERNLDTAEDELDAKKRAYRDAIGKAGAKRMALHLAEAAQQSTDRRLREAKAYRDGEIAHIDWLQDRKEALLKKKDLLQKDMEAKDIDAQKIIREAQRD
jgi:hypothetical protein